MKKNIFAPVGHFKHFGEGGGKPFSFIFFLFAFPTYFVPLTHFTNRKELNQ